MDKLSFNLLLVCTVTIFYMSCIENSTAMATRQPLNPNFVNGPWSRIGKRSGSIGKSFFNDLNLCRLSPKAIDNFDVIKLVNFYLRCMKSKNASPLADQVLEDQRLVLDGKFSCFFLFYSITSKIFYHILILKEDNKPADIESTSDDVRSNQEQQDFKTSIFNLKNVKKYLGENL
jgi:hypothetical protein